jgi:hypothetical protein
MATHWNPDIDNMTSVTEIFCSLLKPSKINSFSISLYGEISPQEKNALSLSGLGHKSSSFHTKNVNNPLLLLWPVI